MGDLVAAPGRSRAGAEPRRACTRLGGGSQGLADDTRPVTRASRGRIRLGRHRPSTRLDRREPRPGTRGQSLSTPDARLLFEARVLATIGDIEGAEAALAEAEALFGQSVDHMVLAQLDGVRGQIALVNADPAHAAEMFERAVNAASLAGAALLSIECTEDLALALAELDPSDERVRGCVRTPKLAEQRSTLPCPKRDSTRSSLDSPGRCSRAVMRLAGSVDRWSSLRHWAA